MTLLSRFKKKVPTSPRFHSGSRSSIGEGRDPDSKDVGKEPLAKRPVRVVNKKQTVKAYQIIKQPHITEKATWLAEQNKHVFRVAAKTNKIEIKKAIEGLYRVKVDRVRIIHIAPKKRRLGRHQGYHQGLKQGFKKAIVTLKKGQKIELLAK
ncbi:MAG: 50S ribosomal protein L23 [Parcubacteria group bacterium]|nr:50S ribosomal protein L23 [Parcubacteria group bacterium]